MSAWYSRISVEPATEPVTATEAKTRLDIGSTAHDDEITAKIIAARQQLEACCNIALITQTRVMKFDCFPAIIRPDRPPLIAVTSLAYTDTSGDSQTLDVSKYSTDNHMRPGRIVPSYGNTWPSTYSDLNAVTLTYTCGFGENASDVPATLREAILFMVGAMFEGCDESKAAIQAAEWLSENDCFQSYA